MIQLRGDQQTDDPRLDRLVQFDERSRLFSVAEVIPTAAPLKSRSHPSKLWLDQGQEGACVSFAWHHEAGAQPVPVYGLNYTIARDRYWEMQRRDPWPGGSYPGATPRYGGTSVLAGAQLMQALGYFDEYRWGFDIDDILRAIVYEGGGVFGLPWLDSMFRPRSDGTLDTTGRVIGGHAIYARGIILPRSGTVTVSFPVSGRTVRIKTGDPLVRLRNSWGVGWGIDGECLITASDLQSLLAQNGEFCIPINRRRP